MNPPRRRARRRTAGRLALALRALRGAVSGGSASGNPPAGARPFDPARHGFGFPNPTGEPSLPPGGGPLAALAARARRLVYGRGLCFGMALGALANHARDLDASERGPDPALLRDLRRLHLLQFRPRTVSLVVLYWLRSRGGRPGEALRSLAPPEAAGATLPPAVLCLGPARLGRGFPGALAGAHAVVPYRLERRPGLLRLYVYDPNHPRDRRRYLTVDGSGAFRYGGFSTEGGWGITVVPLTALPDLRRFPL